MIARLKLSFIGLIALALASACTFKEYNGPDDSTAPTASELKASSNFTFISGNILSPKCMSCHSGANPSAGVDLSSYSKIVPAFAIPGNPEGSKLYQACMSGQMPKGMMHLTHKDMLIIYTWIKNGAKISDDSGEGPMPTPEPSATPPIIVKPTFPSIQKNILNTRCISCHSGEKPAGDIDLTAYSKIMRSLAFPPLITPFKPWDSNIFLVSVDGSMPKEKTRLSSQELRAIFDWITSGAAENNANPSPTPSATPDEPGGDDPPHGTGEPGADEPGSVDEPGGHRDTDIDQNHAEPIIPEPCDTKRMKSEPGFLQCSGENSEVKTNNQTRGKK